jgi:DNA-binding transcriptional ArsR family regulator
MAAKPLSIDRIFHALGDPTRRAIVERLSQRPMSVSQLAGPLSITLAAVVQHLQILENSGLIRTEKLGRVRTCSIAPAGIALGHQWFSDRRSTWEHQLDRLGAFLSELDETSSGQSRRDHSLPPQPSPKKSTPPKPRPRPRLSPKKKSR